MKIHQQLTLVNLLYKTFGINLFSFFFNRRVFAVRDESKSTKPNEECLYSSENADTEWLQLPTRCKARDQ